MLFSAPIFWLFFLVVISLLYINVSSFKSNKLQTFILLAASYFFYGYWDVRFLALIIFVSVQTYICSMFILQSNIQSKRRFYLATSVILNLGVLFFFKYFDFFITVANDVNNMLASDTKFNTLNIILPVGISFYIFQTLTFVVDVYKNDIKKAPDLFNYLTYVAFFPQLVAGPIERAVHLLPQFERLVVFNIEKIQQGIRLIIFGLFLKIVVADGLANFSDDIFQNYTEKNSMELLLGILFFSAQIYGDFCGYSTIAIGVACIIGFDLMRNFDTPYLATSVSSFWRKWHISLSTFFRDYVYIPLGGNRGSVFKVALVTLFTFFVSGLWHGAAWGFIVWGVIHGVLLLIERFYRTFILPSNMKGTVLGAGFGFFGWLYTLLTVGFAWVFFRQTNLIDSFGFISRLFAEFTFSFEVLFLNAGNLVLVCSIFLVDMLWKDNTKLENSILRNKILEDVICGILLAYIIQSMQFINTAKNFIYFQF